MRKIISLFIITLFLTSCSTQRDILSPAMESQFKQQNIESPFFWSKNAKIQLKIFGDFQCPACIRFEKDIWETLLNDYAKAWKIWLEYKNYPLNIHKNAPEDALAAMCAHWEWWYEKYSKALYSLEDSKKGLEVTNDERINLAKKIWIDTTKMQQCITEWRYVAKIKQDMSEWDTMWIEWTPSIYANWQIISYTSKESFFNILDQLISK